MSHLRSWKQGWAVILMAGQIGGCTAWRLETLSPAESIAREQPSVVRVEYADEQDEVLYQPEVRDDSLLGRSEPDARRADGVGAIVGSLIAIGNMQGPFDNWGQ